MSMPYGILDELKLQVENLQEEVSCLHKLILNIDHHYNDEINELREQVEKLQDANKIN